MKIEIITTPNDQLKESGFGSLKACKSVLGSIQNMGHNVTLTVCETIKDLEEVVKRAPDLAVLAVKYLSHENEDDIWLSEYFSQQGINYTGSSRDVLKFDSNKVLAKSLLKNKGISTANYFMAIPGQYKCEADLPFSFPLFLKPIDAANGNGIDDQSFVENFSAYESKVLSLNNQYNLPVLVEEYLDGREFTVSIIKNTDGDLIASAVEIVPPESTNGLRILGAQVKTDDSEEMKKIEDDKIKSRVIALAIDAFTILGARDFGRIDIKTNKDGDCFFMEANLVPGMTFGSSYFPKACEVAEEIPYGKVVELILAQGLGRIPSPVPPVNLINADGKVSSVLLPPVL
ncbi:MAG: D-alanine--D-alanine ligase [Gammaproteobacteria bacterium]|nr:D-alanine--D-alanine ligase [Gammaproteobacteria bacterium]